MCPIPSSMRRIIMLANGFVACGFREARMVSSKGLRSFANSGAFLPQRGAAPWLSVALSVIHPWSFPDHFLLWWGWSPPPNKITRTQAAQPKTTNTET